MFIAGINVSTNHVVSCTIHISGHVLTKSFKTLFFVELYSCHNTLPWKVPTGNPKTQNRLVYCLQDKSDIQFPCPLLQMVKL
jgi:hypothetical protein